MPPPRPEHTRDALIAAAQAVAARLGTERLPLKTFCRETGINPSRIYARFDDWRALCDAAGLVGGQVPAEIPADTLLRALHDAILAAGGLETQRRLMMRVHWSKITYFRRFGGWDGVLAALRGWLAENAPEFPYRRALEERIAHQARRKSSRRKPGSGPAPESLTTALPAGGPTVPTAEGPPWPSRTRVTGEGGAAGAPAEKVRACGAPLHRAGVCRAMLHAPVNELGVVLLFGMVAAEIGYAVDSIAAAFPDCVAKRLVAAGPREADARWEPVRIEFEFRSRHFFYHGHDAARCDVIVCWQHDWPDCPIEVLALRDVVARLG